MNQFIGMPLSKILWTDEMTERLKALWTEGHSASEIAAVIFGETQRSFTRSAILGRVHRLGLEGRRKEPRHSRQRANLPPTHKVVVRKCGRFGYALRQFPADQPDPFSHEPPAKHNCGLLALTEDACRWPVRGEGLDTVFCGSQSAKERPYCAYHCGLAYRRPGEKLTSELPSPITGQAA